MRKARDLVSAGARYLTLGSAIYVGGAITGGIAAYNYDPSNGPDFINQSILLNSPEARAATVSFFTSKAALAIYTCISLIYAGPEILGSIRGRSKRNIEDLFNECNKDNRNS